MDSDTTKCLPMDSLEFELSYELKGSRRTSQKCRNPGLSSSLLPSLKHPNCALYLQGSIIDDQILSLCPLLFNSTGSA